MYFLHISLNKYYFIKKKKTGVAIMFFTYYFLIENIVNLWEYFDTKRIKKKKVIKKSKIIYNLYEMTHKFCICLYNNILYMVHIYYSKHYIHRLSSLSLPITILFVIKKKEMNILR